MTYTVAATPGFLTRCHCGICRRASGAPFLAWFTVPAKDFRFTAGIPARFASSAHGRRGFCLRCGTPLRSSSARQLDGIDVTRCSLEHPERLPPTSRGHASSQLPWIHLADHGPRFAGPPS